MNSVNIILILLGYFIGAFAITVNIMSIKDSYSWWDKIHSAFQPLKKFIPDAEYFE